MKQSVKKKAPGGKTLNDWQREAAECNLDYGTYRALIDSGKTYDELKAAADTHTCAAHSAVGIKRVLSRKSIGGGGCRA